MFLGVCCVSGRILFVTDLSPRTEREKRPECGKENFKFEDRRGKFLGLWPRLLSDCKGAQRIVDHRVLLRPVSHHGNVNIDPGT